MSDTNDVYRLSLRKDPIKVAVDKYEFEFKPEVTGAEFQDAYRHVYEVMGNNDEVVTPEFLGKQSGAARKFLQTMANDAKTDEALDKAALPDWVFADIVTYLVGIYGGDRPTGPSNDSSSRRPRKPVRSTPSSR